MENNGNKRLYGMIGFAMRAGKVIIGTESVCSGKAKPHLVLIAESASEGTKKKLFTKAEFYGVDTMSINIDSGELGRLLGKLYAPATVAIADEHFAIEIRRAISVTEGDSDGTN